jgi:hypothetical protein
VSTRRRRGDDGARRRLVCGPVRLRHDCRARRSSGKRSVDVSEPAVLTSYRRAVAAAEVAKAGSCASRGRSGRGSCVGWDAPET